MIIGESFTDEQSLKLTQITLQQNKERFESLGKKKQEEFYQDLLVPEKNNGRQFLPEQAQRITDLFRSGHAGSVEEALAIMQKEDFDERNTHR